METIMPISKTRLVIHRLADVLVGDYNIITIILGLCGVMLGLGFYYGDVSNNNYQLLTAFAPANVWAVGFILYGLIKLYQYTTKVADWVCLVNAVQGIWAWSYLLLSFVVLDTTRIAPTELMLFVPLIFEVWELAAAIFKFSTRRRRKRNL